MAVHSITIRPHNWKVPIIIDAFQSILSVAATINALQVGNWREVGVCLKQKDVRRRE